MERHFPISITPQRGIEVRDFLENQYMCLFGPRCLINSVQKIVCMDHDVELIIPDPGNLWKFDFHEFLISWKYWEFHCFYFPLSWKYWKLKSWTFSVILEILEIEVFNILYNPGNTGGGLAAPGARLRRAWIIFGTCSWKNEHGNLGTKGKTSTFLKMASQEKNTLLISFVSKFCRTLVSIPKYLSPQPPNHVKNFKYSSLEQNVNLTP